MLWWFLYSELCDLAEKYGALTFIDECHATGFLGETGRYLDSLELMLSTCQMYVINCVWTKFFQVDFRKRSIKAKNLVDLKHKQENVFGLSFRRKGCFCIYAN